MIKMIMMIDFRRSAESHDLLLIVSNTIDNLLLIPTDRT